jgi:hypothetical protein
VICRWLQTWGSKLLRAAPGVDELGRSTDLLAACITAVDGEKDPRCLLLAFDLLLVRGGGLS